MERMLKYFIRTDNLGEVIRLQKSFMNARKVPIAASTLSELGGYLLDKRLEKPDRVLDAHIDNIEGIKDVLIRAVQTDDEYRKKEYKRTGRVPPPLPEPHYQLARYYHFYNAPLEERQTLETAAAAFDAAVIENPKRTRSRIETQRMLADMMIKDLQWFDAEDTLAKGVSIYEDALERRIVKRRYADAGKLYAALGNIEYFIKNDDMESAVRYYLAAERNDWSPPEQQYRIGAAYYHLENYPAALERFFDVSMLMPYNRRLLSALGNVSYLRSDYFAAQGYYNRLVRLLESDRLRFPSLTPDERADHAELLRRLMIALNNQGVALSALSARTGKPAYRVEALARFSESARYWDLLSRDNNMVRPGLVDPGIPGKSLPYLNIRQTLYPVPGANPQLYNTIDKDVLEPSEWEELASKTDVPGG
jgi:tetratricopeptide (TPR) repeat protein